MSTTTPPSTQMHIPASNSSKPPRRIRFKQWLKRNRSQIGLSLLALWVTCAIVAGLHWLFTPSPSDATVQPSTVEPKQAKLVGDMQTALDLAYRGDSIDPLQAEVTPGITDITRAVGRSSDTALNNELATQLTQPDFVESDFNAQLARLVPDTAAQSRVQEMFGTLRSKFQANNGPYKGAKAAWTELRRSGTVVRFSEQLKLNLGGGLIVSGGNLSRMLQTPPLTDYSIANLLREQLTDDGPATPEKYDDRRQAPAAKQPSLR